MKLCFYLFCALMAVVAIPQANASTLYAATSAGGPGELWIIDPTNGAPVQDVGPLNDTSANNYAVTGLAFNPITGVLYGSTGAKSGTELLVIDPATATVTVIGSYNLGLATMSDIAFDASGHLFGISSADGANLCSIDTATGLATVVGPSGVTFTQGGGLAISPSGVIYGTPTTHRFGTYDPTSGVYTQITDPARPAGASASYGSLAFDGNTLYGMNLGSPTHLVIIDPAGNVTDLGTSVGSIDAIAFQPVISRPALTIARSLGGVVLDWPTSPAGFTLQQNPDLNTTNWVANTNSITTTGGTNEVTISPATGNMFFRLIGL
jgi:hypothetical protein